MSRLNWNRCKTPKGTEPAFKKKEQPKGGWTHVKRQPVQKFTPEQIAQWMKDNGERP